VYWIAFTLGIFGSLHCIGMCGPLAIAVFNSKDPGTSQKTYFSSLYYNIGRTVSYTFLGIIFGLLGSLAMIAGMQRGLSVFAGTVLLLIFIFSLNPDQIIGKITFLSRFYKKIISRLHFYLTKIKTVSYFNFGIINGFLPCGLVYLALAGALSLGNVWGSAGFMMFFGLGTIPAMAALLLFQGKIGDKLRWSLRRLYPLISLFLGIYLIYRGLFSTLPMELNFIEAIKHPILCH
jgi:uncharacterized protein